MSKSINQKILLIFSFFTIQTISSEAKVERLERKFEPFVTMETIPPIIHNEPFLEKIHFLVSFATKNKINIQNAALYMNTTTGAGGGQLFLKEGAGKGSVTIYLGSWITPIKDRIIEKNITLSDSAYAIMIEMKQYKGKYYAVFTVGNGDGSFYLEQYIVSWTSSNHKPQEESKIPCEATPLKKGVVRISNQGEWLQGIANQDGKVLLALW